MNNSHRNGSLKGSQSGFKSIREQILPKENVTSYKNYFYYSSDRMAHAFHPSIQETNVGDLGYTKNSRIVRSTY